MWFFIEEKDSFRQQKKINLEKKVKGIFTKLEEKKCFSSNKNQYIYV